MSKTISSNASRIIGALYITGFTLFIVKLVITGDAYDYVHPRFIPFLAGSAVLSALIVIAMIAKTGSTHQTRFSFIRVILLFIPLLFAFTMKPSIVDATGEERIRSAASSSTSPQGTQSTTGIAQPVIDARKSSAVNLDDDHFFMILQDMYDNPSFYDGKKISLRGKVMRKKSSPADECAAVRMLMTCCAADLQPVGFECRYSDAVKLDRSKWYDVHGTIRLAVIDGDTIPVIQADEFNEAAKPKTEYIYPIM